MAHLSSADKPWGKPFTTKRYIHPPLAENIVTMWPNSMIMIGEIPPENPQYHYKHPKYGWFWGLCSEDSAALVFTLKRVSDLKFRQRDNPIYQHYTWSNELMPAENTKYHTRPDGIPVHSFSKDMDAVTFHEEAFCNNKRVPIAYIKVTIENNFGFEEKIELSGLVRRGMEFLFTGCNEPDGYDGYHPTRERFLDAEKFEYKNGILTDGRYKLYPDQSAEIFFDGGNDFTIALTLAPYEKRSFTFAFTRNEEKPKNYATARAECIKFWKAELSKAKNLPDMKGVEPLFYNFLAQMLQMFAHPHDRNYTIMRQGATQRYHWPEAVEMVRALALIGGYSDYLDAGLAHYFDDLQEKSGDDCGRIFYAHVPWNIRTAIALSMLSAAAKENPVLFDKYIESAMLAFKYCERERAKTSNMEGITPGLMPPGICTDHHISKAQQWTFADTNAVRCYAAFAEMLKEQGSEYAEMVEAAYLDYLSVIKNIFEKYADEQRNSQFLYIPRDSKNIPEIEAELNKDPFGYMCPNGLLSVGGAGYGTPDAEKLIYTYSHGGQSKNGLIEPCYRSTAGTGRTWYTTAAEMRRFEYYVKCNNRKEQKKLIDALLKYNVTTEYLQPERIDDHNAYIAPWMPNASANGRLLQMLFAYYGSREIPKM